MCGINGFICKRKIEDGEYRINRMNDSLRHRDPNAEGYIEIDGGYIGQRRLAVIDVDLRSNQPMWTSEKDAVIVYNGEIYNYRELKSRLHGKLRTESDTEVLLAGIKEYGIDWIKECNGMFAFAFVDARENKMILCRDRLGIKPLYYYMDKEHLIFSSEIKGILNSGLIEAKFNRDTTDEYLGNRYVREPYTFFEGIYQVLAGHYLIINRDLETKPVKYWNLPDEFNMDSKYDEDELYDQFKARWWMLYEENVFRFFHQYHIKGLLQRVDTMTMYASIEARVPFLDHKLIEFVYKEVPYELKLRWNRDKVKKKAKKRPSSFYSERWDQPKYLLRRLGSELLPEDVVNRKKMGFPVPLNIWFEELKEMGIKLLKDSSWFDYAQLEKLYEDCKKNIRSGQLLWMFINIELFRKMYFEREWRY